MIEGLEHLHAGRWLPPPQAVRQRLIELLGGSSASGRLVEQRRLASSVFRLHFEINARRRSVILKRLSWTSALRNEMAAGRWLPAIGLPDAGPPLRACIPDGPAAWHLYEDLGDQVLKERELDCKALAAAVDLIAAVHTRFADHPLLAECRLRGANLGIDAMRSSVVDALRIVEALERQAADVARALESRATTQNGDGAGALPELARRLVDRLQGLAEELPRRRAAASAHAGPDTFLHGDLWPQNVLISGQGVLRARLIDFDRCGVGPVCYDLSTFLSRFPRNWRPGILDLYARRVAPAGWQLPEPDTLNLLFHTAESARLANCTIWPALALVRERADWAWPDLIEVNQWWQALEDQLLPDTGPAVPPATALEVTP